MKKIFVFVLCIALCSFSLFAREIHTRLSVNEIPEPIAQLLAEHFADVELVYAEKEVDGRRVEYELILAGGLKLQFNKQFVLEEAKGKDLPLALLPAELAEYIRTHHANTGVVEYELDGKYHEVELSNGVEIRYNPKSKNSLFFTA